MSVCVPKPRVSFYLMHRVSCRTSAHADGGKRGQSGGRPPRRERPEWTKRKQNGKGIAWIGVKKSQLSVIKSTGSCHKAPSAPAWRPAWRGFQRLSPLLPIWHAELDPLQNRWRTGWLAVVGVWTGRPTHARSGAGLVLALHRRCGSAARCSLPQNLCSLSPLAPLFFILQNTSPRHVSPKVRGAAIRIACFPAPKACRQTQGKGQGLPQGRC